MLFISWNNIVTLFRLFGYWLWTGLYLMCFIYVWLWIVQNWIKIFLNSSSRILESCPLVSFWLFVGDFEQAYFQCVKSALTLYFAVLVCLSFSWGQHYSVLALNIVDSPILVFIPIVPGQFEQVLPNFSSFDQSNVSSSLRKLVKPRNQRNIHEVLFKSLFPNLVAFWLCLLAQNKIDSIYIYTCRRQACVKNVFKKFKFSKKWPPSSYFHRFWP